MQLFAEYDRFLKDKVAQIEAKDEIEIADSSLKTIAGTLDFQVISLIRNGVQCKMKKSELVLNLGEMLTDRVPTGENFASLETC